MANGKGGNDFVVRLEGIPLPDDARNRISGEIQAAVMREIAKIDTGGDMHARIPHREWYGLWLRKELFPKEIGALQVSQKVGH